MKILVIIIIETQIPLMLKTMLLQLMNLADSRKSLILLMMMNLEKDFFRIKKVIVPPNKIPTKLIYLQKNILPE